MQEETNSFKKNKTWRKNIFPKENKTKHEKWVFIIQYKVDRIDKI